MWRDQVPHSWVTGDDELGRHTQFRGELRQRGEQYVLGVPCTTTVRDLEVPLPAYQGRGRPPKSPLAIGACLATIAPRGGVDTVDGVRR
jgi:hypothetical protein